MKKLNYFKIVLLASAISLMLCGLCSCSIGFSEELSTFALVTEASNNITSTESEMNSEDISMNQESKMENWIGNYKTVEGCDEINGMLSITMGDDGFYYAEIKSKVADGTLNARLFIEENEDIIVLTWDKSLDENSIDNYQVSDVVMMMKQDNGNVLSRVRINDTLTQWDTVFVKE